MTVGVRWAILQASSRLAGRTSDLLQFAPHHSTNRGLRVTSDSAISLLSPLPIMAAAEPALPVRLMVAGAGYRDHGLSDEMGRP